MDRATIAELNRKREERLRWVSERITPDDKLCSSCTSIYRDTCRGRMSPRCNASIDAALRLEEGAAVMRGVSADDWDVYAVHENPVLWAKAMFGWEARWYQKELLSCSAQKKIVRAGRRIGKSWSLAVDALWKACTKPRSKILVICPFQDQVGILFQIMRELIVDSKGLVVTKRDVHQPQRLEFHNGSYILGITAGTRTGMQGNKARGQDATDMYLDEADYLDQPSLESLLAIFASDENCTLWASSTPTGKRAWFWEMCTKKETSGFKEFHYKSNVSPAWNAEMEQSYRDMYPAAVYAHEFDAEFGDQETGVYQRQYIDASIEDYYYSDCKRNWKHGYLYALGVDWNAHKNGVHIIAIEYDPVTEKIKTVLHESIEAEQFTQTKAVEFIINLHAKWKFDSIYVDRGFGDVQIEQLHLYGQKHSQSRLAKIVRGIMMQESVVIRDPATKKEVKKNAKQLIVNITARRVECEQCTFPRSEDVRHGLVWQLRNFKAERISRDGIPVYSTKEDHALVAWQLAVFGLIMEFTDIAKAKHATKIAFADVHGTRPVPVGQEVPDGKRAQVERRRRLQIVARSADEKVKSLGDTRRRTMRDGRRSTFTTMGVKRGRTHGVSSRPVGRRTF